ASPRKKIKLDVVLPDKTELDKLFIATLESGKDDAKKALALYGPVTSITEPVRITVHGTCLNAGKNSASAGAAMYAGLNSRWNFSEHVNGHQTGARAELLAVTLALRKIPPFKSLIIWTRSEYAIRSAVY
ncbi:hypothetical protein B0H12DRAFT_985217, partial [Mycena haematopus]